MLLQLVSPASRGFVNTGSDECVGGVTYFSYLFVAVWS